MLPELQYVKQRLGRIRPLLLESLLSQPGVFCYRNHSISYNVVGRN